MILRFSVLLAAVALLVPGNDAFVPAPLSATSVLSLPSSSLLFSEQTTSAASVETSQNDDSDNPLGLTPELLKLANAFESIGDDKLRYKQLLYMAGQLAPLDESKKVPENKVPGCLSTVHIDAMARVVENTNDIVVDFQGDSDGLLTKGLVALLIRGLSGNAPEAIQKVDPSFIEKAGIAASLTPGRNNGFLNMLAVMKKKALEVQQEAATEEPETTETSDDNNNNNNDDNQKPMYTAITQALQALKPTQLELQDVSHQLAKHAQAGGGDETHFDLFIVADAFDGLNLVKRHQLVYMLIGQVMPQIRALQINAKTPAEVGEQ